MKNKLFVLAGLMMACAGVSAQNYFGLTGGYNLSKVSVENPSDYCENKFGSGFNVGVAYEHRFKSTGNSYPFIDASILYSLEKRNVEYSVDLNDMVGCPPAFDIDMKFLKIPVSFGYNFQVSDKFGIGPKVFAIFDGDFSSQGLDPYFAFGGGVNFNIGERASIGIGHDLNYRNLYFGGDVWSHNTHANFTYYIFSK